MRRGLPYYFTLLCASVAAVSLCAAMQRRKRDTCSSQKSLIDDMAKDRTKFHTVYTFSNDSNSGVQMAWTGEDNEVIILVTTKVEDLTYYVVNYPSQVYISVDGGHSFKNIAGSFDSDGNAIIIRSVNGLQNSPIDPNHVILLMSQQDQLKIWVSFDGGVHWAPGKAPKGFDLSHFDPQPLRYNMRAADSQLTQSSAAVGKTMKHWLFARGLDSNLYASIDGGLSWTLEASNVIEATWATTVDSLSALYYLTDETGSFSKSSGYKPKYGCCTLKKLDLSKSGSTQVIANNVYSFGVFGNYLYSSIWDSSAAGRAENRRSLKVSSDGGASYQAVQLPTATPDTFYSILTVDAGQAFVHVDEQGDSGRGVLYVSDANGTIFSESLDNHFYPDYLGISDFNQVKSMRGTYLSTAISPDSTMYSVITFNRGADWQRISKPTNVDCDSSVKASECNLQIISDYALFNTHSPVTGALPLSTPSARGIVLAHGHAGPTIQAEDPDVYLSTDGGYSWKRVLKGPHHYEIAHFGALLVAVPMNDASKTDSDRNILHFSVDGGACWHELTFAENDFTVTGVVTAPGNRDLSIALWGYTDDFKWRVHVMNFEELFTRNCTDADYETWVPHVSDGQPVTATDGCLLGARDTYKRLRADAWCAADPSTNLSVSSTVCPCTEDDFDCAYGFYRPTTQSENCVRHPNITVLEVCLHGDLDEVISDGYTKIPGDVCVGGFQPKFLDEQLKAIKASCDDDDKLERSLLFDDDGHLVGENDKAKQLNSMSQQSLAKIQQTQKSQSNTIVVVVCIIGIAALLSGLVLIIIKSRRLSRLSRRTGRYSRLANDEDSARSRLLPLSISANDVSASSGAQDDDEPLMNVTSAPAVANGDDDLVNPRSPADAVIFTNSATASR